MLLQSEGNWQLALRLFAEMRKKGLQQDAPVVVYAMLIECLIKHDQAGHALQVFRSVATDHSHPATVHGCVNE